MNGPMDSREQAALECDRMAQALERAASHLRVTARAYRKDNVPHAAAHPLAAQGHLVKVPSVMRHLASLHASQAQV